MVAASNAIIAASISVILLWLFEARIVAGRFSLSGTFVHFIVLFLAGNAVLNFVTISIILRPIYRLTAELKRVIREGKVRDFDASRYPELEKLIATMLEYIDSAQKERTVALLIKGVSDLRVDKILHDPLTGLFNREFLEKYLPEGLERARLLRQPISVAMLDVDNFKHYNDTQGHQAGDIVLKRISEILIKNTREYDICVRYGGEEFLIILPYSPLSQAQKIAERVRRAIEQESQPGGNLTASIGVASFPEHASDEFTLVKKADMALYHAKRTGKNRVCVYSPQLDTESYQEKR